jgi:pimeloyl-ACP methyl ester carboxylesterase
MKELKPQPAADWDQELTYCGWMGTPSIFLVCENDRLLPSELQCQLAAIAGSEIVRCEAGHMVMLSAPEEVVSVVRGILEGVPLL